VSPCFIIYVLIFRRDVVWITTRGYCARVYEETVAFGVIHQHSSTLLGYICFSYRYVHCIVIYMPTNSVFNVTKVGIAMCIGLLPRFGYIWSLIHFPFRQMSIEFCVPGDQWSFSSHFWRDSCHWLHSAKFFFDHIISLLNSLFTIDRLIDLHIKRSMLRPGVVCSYWCFRQYEQATSGLQYGPFYIVKTYKFRPSTDPDFRWSHCILQIIFWNSWRWHCLLFVNVAARNFQVLFIATMDSDIVGCVLGNFRFLIFIYPTNVPLNMSAVFWSLLPHQK
jgi:hypothetical protein